MSDYSCTVCIVSDFLCRRCIAAVSSLVIRFAASTSCCVSFSPIQKMQFRRSCKHYNIVNTFSEKIEKVSENRMNLSSSQMYGRASRGVACPPVFIGYSCLCKRHKAFIPQKRRRRRSFRREREDRCGHTDRTCFLHIFIRLSSYLYNGFLIVCLLVS